MKHFVYMLRCKDNSLYTGYTIDLNKRLKKHNDGKASKYTRSRLPVKLVFYKQVDSKSLGLKLEILLKKLNKKEKEKLVLAFKQKDLFV